MPVVEGLSRPKEVSQLEAERTQKQTTQQTTTKIQEPIVQLSGGYIPPKPVPITHISTSSPTSRLGEVTPEIQKQEAERVERAEFKTEKIRQIEQQYPGYAVTAKFAMAEVTPEGSRIPVQKEVLQFTLTPKTDKELLASAKQKIEAVGPTPSREGDVYQVYRLTPEEVSAMSRQQMREAVVGYSIVGGVVSFGIAPASALIGAGIGLGAGQTMKAFQGGGLLTPEEAIQTAGLGASFSVGAGMAMAGLKGAVPVLAKQTLAGAASRIAVTTGMVTTVGAVGGGVQAYATGADVAEGVKAGAVTGAAFGLAIGVGREVIGYAAPKVYGKIQESFAKSQMSENLSKYYEIIGEGDVRYQPTLAERSGMKITGLRPVRPATGTEMLPTVETVPKEGLVTQYGFGEQMEKGTVPIMKEGKLIDLVSYKQEATVMKGTLFEKEPLDSIANMIKGTGARMEAGMQWDPNQMAYGLSVEPAKLAELTAKIPVTTPKALPLMYWTGTELIQITELETSLPKGVTEPKIEGKKLPESILQKEYQSKVATEQLAFQKTPYRMGYESPYGFEKQALPTMEKLLPTEVPPPTVKGGMKPFGGSIGSKPQTAMIFDTRPITQVTEIKTGTYTSGMPSAGVGVPITVTKTTPAHPFLTYQGTPYYQTRTRTAEETELAYVSYPASGLRHPQAPTQPQVPLLRNIIALAETIGFGVRERATPDVSQAPVVTPALTQPLIQMPTPRFDIPVPEIPEPETPQPPPPSFDIPTPKTPSWLPPSGFKFEGFGFDRYPQLRFGLIASRKKRYPILSPEQFLGL